MLWTNKSWTVPHTTRREPNSRWVISFFCLVCFCFCFCFCCTSVYLTRIIQPSAKIYPPPGRKQRFRNYTYLFCADWGCFWTAAQQRALNDSLVNTCVLCFYVINWLGVTKIIARKRNDRFGVRFDKQESTVDRQFFTIFKKKNNLGDSAVR